MANCELEPTIVGAFPVVPTKFFQRKVADQVRGTIEEVCSSDKPGVVVVYGDAGVGKTSLVAQTLAENDVGANAVLWINLFKLSLAPRFDESAFYGQLLDLLIRFSSGKCLKRQPEPARPTLLESIKKELDEIATSIGKANDDKSKGKVLIVLDHVFNPYAIQCIPKLGQHARCVAIARCNMMAVVASESAADFLSIAINVEPMNQDELEEVLLGSVGAKMHIDDEQLDKLAEISRGLPAVTQLIASQFDNLTTKRQIDAVYENFIHGVERLGRKAMPHLRGGSKNEKIQPAIDGIFFTLSFKSEELRSILYTFLLFQPGQFVEFDELLLLWKQFDPLVARQHCDCLVDEGFLMEATFCSISKLAMHDFFYQAITAHALQQRYLGSASVGQIRTRLIEFPLVHDDLLRIAIRDARWSLIEVILRDTRNIGLLAQRSLEVDGKTGQTPLHLLLQYQIGRSPSVESNNHHQNSNNDMSTPTEFLCNLTELSIIEHLSNTCSAFVNKDKVTGTSIYNRLRRACRVRNNIILTAARLGCSHFIRLMIELRISDLAEAVDESNGDNALIVAASQGYSGLVKYLIEVNKLNVNFTNKKGETALKKTVKMLSAFDPGRCLSVVSELLKAAEINVNQSDKLGTTPLITSVRNGCTPVVEKLLAHGANVNLAERSGENALIASFLTRNHHITELLVAAGAKMDQCLCLLKANYGFSEDSNNTIIESLKLEEPQSYVVVGNCQPLPIHEALLSNDIERLAALLDNYGNEINLDSRNETGDTALAVACLYGQVLEALMLIRAGAAFDDIDDAGNSALILASGTGLDIVVELLLRLGASFERSNRFGDTPLMYAAKEGHAGVAEMLIRCGSNLEDRNEAGCTALILSAASGHTGVFELLIRFGANIEATDQFGCSALNLASLNGWLPVVDLLLRSGARIERCDDTGWTALHSACIGENAEVVDRLIANGANLESVDQFGNTPLLLGSRSGKTQTVELLLRSGANVRAVNQLGDTALIAAVSGGHYAVAKLLIQFDSNNNLLNSMNSIGNSALHMAAWKGHLDVVELLIQSGATLELVNQFGMTALTAASVNGHSRVVAVLICSGATFSEPLETPSNHTALHWASWKGYSDVVELLTRSGSSLETMDRYGNTPLMLAAAGGQRTVVEMLALSGSSLDIVNDAGNSALLIACLHEKDEVAEFLVDSGANVKLRNIDGYTALSIVCAHNSNKTTLQKIASVLQSKIGRTSTGSRRLVDKTYPQCSSAAVASNTGHIMSCNAGFGDVDNKSLVFPDILYAALYLLNATMNIR